MTDELKQWVTKKQLAAECPAINEGTLDYVLRADNRERFKFQGCVRFLSPRRMLIHKGRFLKRLESGDWAK